MEYLMLKYYFGSLIAIPLLPLMYFQGKKIRADIPNLPEALGPSGSCNSTTHTGRTVRMIAIGESTIAGVGVKTHKEGFAGSLARELSRLNQMNVDWKVYARSGYTAKDVSVKIVPEIKEKNIDLIVVGLGGNDAFSLNSPRVWKKNIGELIKRIQLKFPNSPIVFINMPPIKEFPAFTPAIKLVIGNLVEILGKVLKNEIQKYDQVFYYGDIIAIDEWVEKLQIQATIDDFFSDGVHPSKLTYQTWAKDIAYKITNEDIIKKKIPMWA
jgi:lysophospholipase L1-like esterase